MPSTLIVISYALLVLPIQQVFGYEALYDFHSHQVTHHGAMGKRNFKMFASDYLPPGVDTAQLLRRRGYVAQQHYVTTSDGYVLSLVRGTNPLINEGLGCKKGKKPILFIHGPLVSAPVWLANSANVWPRDFSSLNISLLGMELLELTLSNEPSTNSLPFLAMNFGHEVWMFNGRGTLESQNEIGRRNRTLLDAVADLVPSLLGGGFGMQPLVDIRGPKVHEAEIVEHHELGTEHHHVGPHHLGSHDVGHQELGYHDGEHYIVRRSGANNHHYHHQAHQAHQAPRNTLFDFIRPLINMPAALLDYGNFFERLLNTFDAQFWSYSMDEQAEFDFPAALDYVLSSSGQDKAAVVAHSNGAAMVLMGASTKPHLAHKIAKTVLFAPALNMGNSFVNNLLPLITPLIQSYLGPIPFGFMSQQLESIVQALCDTQMKQQFICEDVADLLFGPSNNQAPILFSLASNFGQPTSARELIQLIQSVNSEVPRRFGFNSRRKNILAYGQDSPPFYNLSRVCLDDLTIFSGATDKLVQPEDVLKTISQLTVPVDLRVVDGYFNHIGYFNHRDIGRLVNLPTLYEIERAQ